MPVSPLLLAGVQAGGDIVSSGINAISQAATNKKQREFAEHMYDRQRQDALSDWALQTEYNSPSEQMKRLRDAKLNPNLVYGDSVTQSAPAVRASSAPAWNPQAPRYGDMFRGAGASLAMYYDVKLKEAQTNNVVQATTTAIEEAALKRAQTWATIKSAGKTDLEAQEIMVRLSRAQELTDISVDAAKANVQRTYAETKVLLNRDEREAIQNITSVKEAAARILHMRYENSKIDSEKAEIAARIKKLETDTDIANEDLKLKRAGVQPHDALWQRKLADWIEGLSNGGDDQNLRDFRRTPKGRERGGFPGLKFP